jgi:hypothetical protein
VDDNVPFVPEGVLVLAPVPLSDPVADAPELGAPPALAEVNEYIDETDIRFVSKSRIAGSGSWECLDSSAIMPGDNLGVSKSSTAISSLLVLRLGPDPCAQSPETPVR